ncbi:glycerol-3-phosphate 1-O-acyltransferase PlsY [Candidatus Spongiisocius sp.]|uniref:glycerol-3-phosphate 1-O-acyltransferase PlsY n=1 Tax=Candidatus Spongiisocius sp. TaxID=3101273 RepID=UPI003B5B6011
MLIGAIALFLGAYLLGGVNMALAVSRARGVDIRQVGSGNPGASNVLRAVGKGPAVLVYLVDLAKGFVPALVGLLVWSPYVGAAAGLAAVLGHCYPVYHRFRGGKGVATAGGAVLAVAPPVMVAMVIVYGVALVLSRISAVGSLAAAVVSIPALLLTGQTRGTVAWFALMMVLIVFRHRSNLSRLRSGTENRLA